MKNKYFQIIIIILVFLLTPEISIAQPHYEHNSDSINNPFKVQVYNDHNIIRINEKINIKVWIESDIVDYVNISIVFAKNQFIIDGKSTFSKSVPMVLPANFELIGKSVGKSNILVSVSGTNKVSKEKITSFKQVNGLEVQGKVKWWAFMSLGPLLGVLIGSLVTFILTIFHDLRETRKEQVRHKLWIRGNLPAQLEFNRVAILNEQKTEFGLWMDKLLNEGYYSYLQRLSKQNINIKRLSQTLIETGINLREYETKRMNKRLEKVYKEDLALKLEQLIEELNKM